MQADRLDVNVPAVSAVLLPCFTLFFLLRLSVWRFKFPVSLVFWRLSSPSSHPMTELCAILLTIPKHCDCWWCWCMKGHSNVCCMLESQPKLADLACIGMILWARRSLLASEVTCGRMDLYRCIWDLPILCVIWARETSTAASQAVSLDTGEHNVTYLCDILSYTITVQNILGDNVRSERHQHKRPLYISPYTTTCAQPYKLMLTSGGYPALWFLAEGVPFDGFRWYRLWENLSTRSLSSSSLDLQYVLHGENPLRISSTVLQDAASAFATGHGFGWCLCDRVRVPFLVTCSSSCFFAGGAWCRHYRFQCWSLGLLRPDQDLKDA